MGNVIDESKGLSHTRQMSGRRVIKTSAKEITEDNLVYELLKAMEKHYLNRSEIEYLWDYYRGKQPILHRVKEIRPEINNKIVENRANEIVSFKVGYLCGEPIQYIGRNGDEDVTGMITRLNELMFSEDKASQDQEIVEWQMICGTAFRLVLPDEKGEEDDAPFEMYTLDPRDTFVVYSNDIGNKPLFAVKYSVDDDKITHYSVYTENYYWQLDGDLINYVESQPHALGVIPIFEYPANNARLGAFEIVLPLLDMINNIESNRMDSMEQTVQSFLKFINCDIDKEGLEALKELGAVKVKSTSDAPANVEIVQGGTVEQTQAQTAKDDVYQSILTICGMPNRNGGTSTSDTGAAVLLRDGWSLAEARAKDSEHIFKKAEKQMLKLILRICRDKIDNFDLKVGDIQLQFTRRNYENIQSKSQVLTTLLDNPKVHPLLAFQHSGLFVDPESAYQLSTKYYEEQLEQWNPIEVDEDAEREESVQAE